MNNSHLQPAKKTCEVCKTDFTCGGDCWCAKWPTILPLSSSGDCLCPQCLKKALIKRIRFLLNNLTPEIEKQIKDLGIPETLTEDIDYTINAKGLYVFTSWYLLRRGYCCGNGCLNCPYKRLGNREVKK